jgi:hypothetical protein
MGTRLIAGRDVTWADIDAGGRVALISEEFARARGGTCGRARHAHSGDHRDRRLARGHRRRPERAEDSPYAEAPGVVYWPAFMENAFGNSEFALQPVAYVVRSDRAGTGSLTTEIRNAVWSVNSGVPIALELTMQTLYSGSLAERRSHS